MHLIQANPLPTPADAERLVADLWQLTSGRALGLYLFGLRDQGLTLGVHCKDSYVEDLAASTVSDQIGGQVDPGWAISQMIEIAEEHAVINLVPTDRNLVLESRTFGWQRTDPLRSVFQTLNAVPSSSLAGIGMTLRALPNLRFVVSIAAFAVGPGAGPIAVRLASSYGGVGVRLRRPFLQKRAISRTLEAAIRRPSSIKRVEDVTLYWHPPYATDTTLRGLPQHGDQTPAGHLY